MTNNGVTDNTDFSKLKSITNEITKDIDEKTDKTGNSEINIQSITPKRQNVQMVSKDVDDIEEIQSNINEQIIESPVNQNQIQKPLSKGINNNNNTINTPTVVLNTNNTNSACNEGISNPVNHPGSKNNNYLTNNNQKNFTNNNQFESENPSEISLTKKKPGESKSKSLKKNEKKIRLVEEKSQPQVAKKRLKFKTPFIDYVDVESYKLYNSLMCFSDPHTEPKQTKCKCSIL